uniref:Uncharacterized protein n=1 Tax=viral metagenome TaxID=1070528 RepID=A0A6M3MCB7_9ZZZZ
MEIQKQHDLLVLVQDKLTKHFELDEEQTEIFYLTQDEEETTWILFGDRVTFSFDKPDSILGVSFGMDLEPVISAQIIFCLVRNNIDLEIFESYYESKINHKMYWGEEAERFYREEILLEDENCE